MGEVIGTCGHKLNDAEGNALTIKGYSNSLKCLCYVSVCDDCAASYEKDGIVLHNSQEETDYLYGEGTISYILKIMEDRGYSLVSYVADYSIYIFGKTVDDISLNATVQVKEKNSSVELSFHELKMFMQIKTGELSFDHKDFERFEKILIHYAKVCENNNPFDINL